jgi:hypothetical protein
LSYKSEKYRMSPLSGAEVQENNTMKEHLFQTGKNKFVE